MMLGKIESENRNSSGNSNSGQLLRDIEEISKALYLHKTPSKALVSSSSSDVRSKSTGKIRLSESKSISNPTLLRKEELLHKDKKLSSLWSWKKPLKALSHIGNQKLDCFFCLHVHSIEGLPANFDSFSLRVHWKRKNEVLSTGSSRVLRGMVEFEETLVHQCSVYGSRTGPNHSMKYDSKLCLIYASIIGAPELDIGKQWVDLTSLLPLTWEELEGEKSRGKWTTSFKLSGKAKGASLNVSFGFWVTQDKLVKMSGNLNFSELVNMVQGRSTTKEYDVDLNPSNCNEMIQRVRSIPGSVHNSSTDVKFCHDILLRKGLELSKSITFLYQKLDEGSLCCSEDADSQHMKHVKPEVDRDFVFAEGIEEYDSDITEFTITEVGTEICESVQLASPLNQCTGRTNDESAIEVINADEIIQDCDIDVDKEPIFISKDGSFDDFEFKVMMDNSKHETNSICTENLTLEEVEPAFNGQSISGSAEVDISVSTKEYIEQENHIEMKSNDKANKPLKRSLSLDDADESVASEFLNMLGMEHDSFDMRSDGDPESPRECLLRQFEKEALASGNFLFDFDADEEQSDFACTVTPKCGFMDYSEDSNLSLILHATEEEDKRVSELLKRRNAKILEDLETEALMQEWGLNEKDFQNSPRSFSGGFGSPIELLPEEPCQLPPLEEGFGPSVQMKHGGFLRSMNPLIFRNAKNGGNLVFQVSSPVVLPAKMGYNVMEILQHLALVGAEKMYMQINKLMPLEDITGKTIKQVSQNAAPDKMASDRQALLGHNSYGWRKGVEDFSPGWNSKNMRSDLVGYEKQMKFVVSLEELAPFALDKVEGLSIEGLRIQSRMSEEKPPSSIHPQFIETMSTSEGRRTNLGQFLSLEDVGGSQVCAVRDSGSNNDGLIDLSITLDEWLRLDAGNFGLEDHNNEHVLKILAAHRAKCLDLVGRRATEDVNQHKSCDKKCGLLGNNLTVALTMQLRDPLRNFEPVGLPMLLLIQVQRVFVSQMEKGHGMMLKHSQEKENDNPLSEELSGSKDEETDEGDEEDTPLFQVSEIHIASVNTVPGNRQLWGTTAQRQSGSRWLLSSGMGKNPSYVFSKSKAIARSSPHVAESDDILWSISSNVHEQGDNKRDLTIPHTRNPDIIFPSEIIRPHETSTFQNRRQL
ncbi:hypothetical protein FEM48_Zijuj06G0055900 [Ziziphus jujuba var. spinosa]|uniref:C2 NT-type domain-containing protein n=1 Tax=Ziziphus jujuba var. spinosa TaxID=714518 RepID=A0A978V7G6_ZIZJJ|nr:hypothetical protein FEM48_Zijuj06G0055900 [Ziziphus jujuba var. spinosa]